MRCWIGGGLRVWSQSPYGRYLDHRDWTRIGLVGAICSALPWGETLVPGGPYVLGRVPMLSTMMLPMALTILDIYAPLVRGRGDRLVLPGWSAWLVLANA